MSFRSPKSMANSIFDGVEVGATPDDFKKYLGDPAWKGHPGVEAMADTALVLGNESSTGSNRR